MEKIMNMFTKEELKKVCGKMGLKKGGLKDDLVERIIEQIDGNTCTNPNLASTSTSTSQSTQSSITGGIIRRRKKSKMTKWWKILKIVSQTLLAALGLTGGIYAVWRAIATEKIEIVKKTSWF